MAIIDTGTHNDSEADLSRFFCEGFVDLHRLDRLRASVLERARAIRCANAARNILLSFEIEGYEDELREYGGYLQAPTSPGSYLRLTVSPSCFQERRDTFQIDQFEAIAVDGTAAELLVPHAALVDAHTESSGSLGTFRPDLHLLLQGAPNHNVFPLEETGISILTPRSH